MTATSHSLSHVFGRNLASERPSGPIARVAELIASGQLSRSTFDSLLKQEGLKAVPSFKIALVDLVLYYARACVQDHEISTEERENLRALRIILRVSECDCYKPRRDVVRRILHAQVSWMLEDRFVSEAEEILQTDLQRAFGLSYDQYVQLVRPLVTTYVEDLEQTLASGLGVPEDAILACIQYLRSVFLLPR